MDNIIYDEWGFPHKRVDTSKAAEAALFKKIQETLNGTIEGNDVLELTSRYGAILNQRYWATLPEPTEERIKRYQREYYQIFKK